MMSTVNDDIEEKTMTFILQQEPTDEDEIVDEAFDYGSTYEPFRSEDDDFPEEFEKKMTTSNLQEELSDQTIMETVSSSDGVEKNEISDYVSSYGSFRSSTCLSVSEYRSYPPCLEIEEIDERSPTSSSISSLSSFSPSQPQSRLITSKRTLTTSMVEWLKTLPKLRASTAALKGHGLESTKQSTGEPKAVQGSNTEVHIAQIPNHFIAESVCAGWPSWLASVAGEAIKGWVPMKADSFLKLEKIGEGRHSNVYKGRDIETGKFVALKKVRFVNMDPESVRFMAREIYVLRRLDHINVIKLEGLITSRMSCSLYFVFEYMEHDLAGLAATPAVKFSEPQVKCYMQQLLRGLDHCHSRGVLHRDIKGSNLLIDNNGILKLADFGLATFFRPDKKQRLTSRVVTLWYRPPELLLGATEYSTAVDLWSVGCILAELLVGKPIMQGRSEVDQLHKIFKLCGSPSEDWWKSKLPHATIFIPQYPYRRCVNETFKDFPPSALALLDSLLAIEPANRGTAISALESEFFSTKPYTCDPSSLPKYPPSKELDAKLRDEETRRQRTAALKGRGPESTKKSTGEPKAVQDSNTEVQRTHAQQNRRSFKVKCEPQEDGSDHCNETAQYGSLWHKKERDVERGNLPAHSFTAMMSNSQDSRMQRSYVDRGAADVSRFSGPLTTSGVRSHNRRDRRNSKCPEKRSGYNQLGVAGATEKQDWSIQLLERPSSSHKKEERDPRDSTSAYNTKQCSINFSGPLIPPGENMDEVLKEHERQVQHAVRKVRFGRGNQKRNHN